MRRILTAKLAMKDILSEQLATPDHLEEKIHEYFEQRARWRV